MRRLTQFFRIESASGIVMLLATALALLAANSRLAPAYDAFIHLPIPFSFSAHSAYEPLAEWVKDVLMVLFFLLVGLELKREMREGVLADRSQILLPLLAALGGMLAPAALFFFINHGIDEHLNGWAIASATDIAFALCVMLLASRTVPLPLKIFLLAIAIFDDLGAILIIAFFYSQELSLMPLLGAAMCSGVLYLLNRRDVARLTPYLIIGAVLGLCLYHAGIHTTVAGVITAMAIPMRDAKHPTHSPVARCMHLLHPWVSFLILPLFAFTAAGVALNTLQLESLLEPLTLGVALGLFLGKQIGIFGTTFLLVSIDVATLPKGTNWKQIYAVSLLAGIGFTMSLFIGSLAFDDPAMQDRVKLGVLTGSLCSALAGWAMLRYCDKK